MSLFLFCSDSPETANSCAARLARMLDALSSTNSAFTQWNNTGWSREEANDPFCSKPPGIPELQSTFEKAFEKDGDFALAAWNGLDGARGIGFRVFVGNTYPYPVFPNNVEVNFPRWTPENADMVSFRVLKSVLLGISIAWDADWGSVSTWPYSDLLAPSGQELPTFRSGWMTYLSPRYALRVVPSPSAIVEHPPNGALLMIATEELFSIENPAHVAAAHAIQASLAPLQRKSAARV